MAYNVTWRGGGSGLFYFEHLMAQMNLTLLHLISFFLRKPLASMRIQLP